MARVLPYSETAFPNQDSDTEPTMMPSTAAAAVDVAMAVVVAAAAEAAADTAHKAAISAQKAADVMQEFATLAWKRASEAAEAAQVAARAEERQEATTAATAAIKTRAARAAPNLIFPESGRGSHQIHLKLGRANKNCDEEQIADWGDWAALGVERIVAGRPDLLTDYTGNSFAAAGR